VEEEEEEEEVVVVVVEGSQLDKVPRRPLLVSTAAHQNALPLSPLAQTYQELTWLG
jgi:hypothetical protein